MRAVRLLLFTGILALATAAHSQAPAAKPEAAPAKAPPVPLLF